MANKRVGVIGGGQLAWMMAEAASNLGIDLIVQTPNPNDPAVKIAADVILAVVDDAAATAQLATRCDVITFENEFINLEALKPLAQQGICFRPSLESLSPLLDKYHQRCYLQKIGLSVPRFTAIQNSTFNSELRRAEIFDFEQRRLPNSAAQKSLISSSADFPVVLKARRHGYDGQGTYVIDNQETLLSTCKRLERFPLMLEEFVPFERELAVIAARSVTGEVIIYPVVETQQENQVCRRVIVPASITPEISLQVEAIARHLLEQLQVVGVFGLELFLTPDKQLLVNEIAPRTHNSGHYTLDACETSQFEMQLLAVTGLPLGSPALKSSRAVMVNLLGYEHSQKDYLEKRTQLAAIPQAHLHWYGKTESRPRRKLGHVTVLLAQNGQPGQWRETVRTIEAIWYGNG